MRRINLIMLIGLFIILPSCKKKEGTRNSGTITINNELTGTGPYYATGFSIPSGTIVSFINSPLDVITIQEDHDIDLTVRKLFFGSANYYNSFFKYGEFADAAAAKTEFDNLKTFTADTWAATGDSVRPNQIWLFRTSDTRYAKIRIISTRTEIKAGMVFPFAESSFEWVFQPDGTKIFP